MPDAGLYWMLRRLLLFKVAAVVFEKPRTLFCFRESQEATRRRWLYVLRGTAIGAFSTSQLAQSKCAVTRAFDVYFAVLLQGPLVLKA